MQASEPGGAVIVVVVVVGAVSEAASVVVVNGGETIQASLAKSSVASANKIEVNTIKSAHFRWDKEIYHLCRYLPL